MPLWDRPKSITLTSENIKRLLLYNKYVHFLLSLLIKNYKIILIWDLKTKSLLCKANDESHHFELSFSTFELQVPIEGKNFLWQFRQLIEKNFQNG